MSTGLPSVCHFSTVHSGVEIRIVRKQLASLAKAGYPSWLVIPGTAQDVEECKQLGIRMIALSDPSQGDRLRRATTLAARGLELTTPRDMWIANSAGEFAESVAAALGDASERARRSASARAIVAHSYARASVVDRLACTFAKALAT